MRDDQFQCEACGEIFDDKWTDEEARKEYEEKFGHLSKFLKMDPACVCDDCYKKLLESDLEKASRLLNEFCELIAETLLRQLKYLWNRIFKK